MDSRLIYSATQEITRKIFWPKGTDTQWVYFGTKGEVIKEIVMENIKTHFSDDNLYVVRQRNNSFQTSKDNSLEAITDLLGVEDFSLWNQPLDRVIQFNRIGVLRRGERNS